MLDRVAQDAANALLQVNAVKFGRFRLKLHETVPTAPLSPIYIDLRVLRSYPDAMDAAVSFYRQLIQKISFDVVADVPTAATPIVAILSHLIRVPMISPRLDAKQHGRGLEIDGSYERGMRAVVIDDLITHAESKLEAINVLERGGLLVTDVVTMLDREQGGVEELERRGYHAHIGFKLTELMHYYASEGAIDSPQLDEVLTYLKTDMAQPR